MDYRFTFEDGSSAYLAHHGVKGMRWGVHNEETKAKYSNSPFSARRDRQIEKAADKVYKRASSEYAHTQATGKRSKLREYRTNRAAQKYMAVSKDSAHQAYQKNIVTPAAVGAVAGGALGAGVATGIALSTKKGRQANQEYRNRVAQVRTHALTDVAATKAKANGSERVSKLLAEEHKRPDVY